MMKDSSSHRFSIRRLARTAVAWGFLGTFLRHGLGALLLVPLMVRCVSSEHLAVWYVFVAMRGFVELLDVGFVSTISRGAAHLSAGAGGLRDFGIADINQNVPADELGLDSQMVSFVAALTVYYRLFAAACFVLLAVVGSAWIWHISRDLPDRRMLQAAWLFYAGVYCLSMTGILWPALLTGINHVREIEQIMIAGSVLNCIITAAGIAAGYGIWALAAGSVTMVLVTRFAARSLFLSAMPAITVRNGARRQCDWRVMRALWPTSWRTSLCALGGYLTLSSAPILCSAFLDLKTTASVGLTLQLLMKLVEASTLWVRVKIPLLNQFRTRGQIIELAETFASRVRISLATYVGGAFVIVLTGAPLLRLIGAGTTLLPIPMLLVMLLAVALQQHQAQYAWLTLTENQNPFAGRVLVTGILVVLTGILLLPILRAWGILLPMLVIPAAYSHWSIVMRGATGLGLPPWHYLRIFLGIRVPS